MSFRRPIRVTRVEKSGQYVNGTYVPGDFPVDVPNVRASIQPAPGKMMQSLPEGRRSSEAYLLYTDSMLYTAETSSSQNTDIVIINDTEFEVAKVGPWQNGVINHYEVLVVKADQ